MTLGRFLLAAKQTGFMQQFRGDVFFDLSCGKQRQKVLLVNLPTPFVLFEILQNLLGGRQVGPVDVIHPADRPEK